MKGIDFERISLDHNGGTKSYHLAWVSCPATGKSILMKRWGKTGSFGQLDVITYTTLNGAFAAADKLQREKTKRGYATTFQKREDATEQVKVAGFFGPAVWNNFGANNLHFLDADIDTIGMKVGVTVATRDEEDRFVGARPAKHVEVDEDALRAAALEQARLENESNPLFGMF